MCGAPALEEAIMNTRKDAFDFLLSKHFGKPGKGRWPKPHVGRAYRSMSDELLPIVLRHVSGSARAIVLAARRVGGARCSCARTSPGCGVNRRKRLSESLTVHALSSHLSGWSGSLCVTFLCLWAALFPAAAKSSLSSAVMRGAVLADLIWAPASS